MAEDPLPKLNAYGAWDVAAWAAVDAVHDQLFRLLISKGICSADEAKAALYKAAEKVRHHSEGMEAANIFEGSVSEIAFELASGIERGADRLG